MRHLGHLEHWANALWTFPGGGHKNPPRGLLTNVEWILGRLCEDWTELDRFCLVSYRTEKVFLFPLAIELE